MRLIRTFVAIKIPVEGSLLDVWADLRDRFPGNQVKWVEHDCLHLTLFFMGDTPEDQIPEIGNDLKKVLQSQSAFELEVKGLGYFGSSISPRVIWVGIERSLQLTKLKRDVSQVISSYGFLDDQRAFNPHITLGRVKSLRDSGQLLRIIHGYTNFSFQKTNVNSVIHYKSELRPIGPIYTSLNEIIFEG